MTRHLRIAAIVVFSIFPTVAMAQAPATQEPGGITSRSQPEAQPIKGNREVKAPQVTYSVEPQVVSNKGKDFHGNVQVYLWIETDGTPTHIKIVHGPGGVINAAVLDAVRQYKFKPATLKGKPVKVDLYMDVNFE